MTIPTVNFLSYNSTGLSGNKCQFIKNICDNHKVTYISIQEHFKWHKTTSKYFSDKFDKHNSYVIPAYRPKCQDSGRAKAGLAQLSMKSVNVNKERIVTKNWRIQAQVLNFPTTRLLWINTYLPTDPHTADFDEGELLQVLSEIESIMDKTIFHDVVLNGDLNWDMIRKSGFSLLLAEFVEKLGRFSLRHHHPVDYTHVHTDGVSRAVLDHFLVNERLLPLVVECSVLHSGDNLSRHSPILLKLNVGDIPTKQRSSSWLPKKPAWSKASMVDILNYKLDMQDRLLSLAVPGTLHCRDPHCSDPAHSSERDSFALDILCSLVESSHTKLPLSGGRKAASEPKNSKAGHKSGGGSVPGWMEEVEPFRQEALFWHAIWKSCEKPNTGEIHRKMTQSRNQYHYAVRRTKRRTDLTKAKKLFEASLSGDMNLLLEMKNIRGAKKVHDDLPDNVAGANGEEEIVEKFREVYQAVFNSAGSAAELEVIKRKLATLIKSESVDEVMKVTGKKVKQAALLMKPGKADVTGGFTTDAFLNAPDIMFEHLAMVYRSWLFHGSVTPTLLACAFLPLLKNALKDPADTSSYRAIAGSSILLKLFDKVILLLWGHLLSSDSLQFGYKVGTSTTQCSWLVTEVVGQFLRNGSNPILTLLDCSRAFDTCKFDILFTKLLNRKVPPIVIRTLIFVYEEQYAWVKWGGAKSTIFSIVNGTRQGSILSPALFAVYVDDLIQELRDLDLGCHVAGIFYGVVGFCDDILLLAPTRDAMEIMLATCERFALKNNLMFSTDPNPAKSKSKCIFVCGKRSNLVKPAPLTLYGKELPWVVSATHLGHELHESGMMDHDSRVKRAEFINKSTEIRESFGFASPVEVLRAVKVFAGDLYGAMLWRLGGDMAKQVYHAWNTCIKLAWSVPRSTHTYFLERMLDCGLSHIRTDTLARYVKYLSSLRESPSMEVVVLTNLVARDVRTTTGGNLHHIREVTGLDPWTCSPKEVKRVLGEKLGQVPDLDEWRLPYLGKLLEERGERHYNMEDTTELTKLIDSLCIN